MVKAKPISINQFSYNQFLSWSSQLKLIFSENNVFQAVDQILYGFTYVFKNGMQKNLVSDFTHKGQRLNLKVIN